MSNTSTQLLITKADVLSNGLIRLALWSLVYCVTVAPLPSVPLKETFAERCRLFFARGSWLVVGIATCSPAAGEAACA